MGLMACRPAELARIPELRAFTAGKAKVAAVLAVAGPADEAEPRRQAAAKALEQARAIENRGLPRRS
jgi:hypothetical protein